MQVSLTSEQVLEGAGGIPEQGPPSRVSRSRYVVLQTLVGIILAYQLLSDVEPIVSRPTSHAMIAGLIGLAASLIFLPLSILRAPWFSGLLAGLDTVVVTATIYLSGNARSDLYLSYFVLMLIAASLRRLSHVIGFAFLLCAVYGGMLYQGVVLTGSISAGHLLGVPVLLVMAVFYGMAMETISTEERQKARLLESIGTLKKTESTLHGSLAQLETRIRGLKDDLSKAQAQAHQNQLKQQDLERQLAEAQKMEAVGRITGGIANEFSRLCSVIGTQTGVVLSQLKQDHPLYGPVDEIFRSGERAAALTAQLAALETQGRAFRQVLPINALFHDLSAVIRGLLPSRIECTITLDPGPLLVEVDREGLEQAILHVVVNARDAMAQGGRLTIEVGRAQPAASSVSIKRTASNVVIQVADTGSGMNRDTQSRMFEPFFSTKETNVGLGLTAVYGIVKQHGGQLEVLSQPGQGTRVRLCLPTAEASARVDGLISESLTARGEETVLLVEPHEIDRKLAVSTLLRHRYRVLEASSPVEALMLTQQHTGGLQVAVSGLVMQDITGRELAKRLLKQYPTMKALFVSGYDDEAILSHRINRRYLLRRPYRQMGLVEKVRELIDA